VVVQDMLRAFGDEDRAAAVDAITGRGGLVLDDLDKVKPSEWACAQLLAAIDSRVQDDRSLLVTMNVTLGQLAEKLGPGWGDAIASRLAGYCEIVAVGGEDRRLNGRQR
jgi:DNA replication protein DnaC